MPALHFHHASTDSSGTPNAPSRIALIDNTAPPPSVPSGSVDQSRSHSPADDAAHQSPQSRRSLGDGKRGTLRKAIAERRYKRWSTAPDGACGDVDDEDLEEAPDERAEGMVVERDSDDEGEDGTAKSGYGGGSAESVNADGVRDSGGDSTQRGRAAEWGRERGPANNGVGGTGQLRRKGNGEVEIAEIDVLYENQRGAFFCGIPLFSSKSLLNFDPSAWQNGLFHDSAVSIVDAQVPDPSWTWDWASWYVDMTSDVDEEGWAYSFSFSPAFAWHGNHIWFHSFVRRRRWLRKRVKLPQRALNASGDPYGSTIDGSVMRAGHGMNNDYFTIHSRKDQDSWHAGGSHKRKSVLEGGSWGGTDDESDHEVEIKDVATLMRVVKRARLDREKIEAIMRFVEDSGDEVAYLSEKMPALMGMMIFQASRRQLLSHILDYTEQYEAGEAPVVTIFGRSSPDEVPTPVSTTSSQRPLTEPKELAFGPVVEGKHPKEDSPETRMRKVENLKEASKAADQEVKKMEFWSDVKDVARKGDSLTAEAPTEGWSSLGISGASIGNEKIFGGAGNGGVREETERVDLKGKGKAIVR